MIYVSNGRKFITELKKKTSLCQIIELQIKLCYIQSDKETQIRLNQEVDFNDSYP